MEPAWADPGAVEVAAGVHRMPLPLPDDGLRAVNVYAVADGGGVALIDAGWAIDESRVALGDALASIGYHVTDITRVLVTHMHRDHYTQAVTLRRELGVPVSLGVGERPSIDWLTPERLRRPVSQIARLYACGADDVARELEDLPPDDSVDGRTWEPPDVWLDGEPEIAVGDRVLRAIPTPGHTHGHYVFHDPAHGLLFSGDHILPHITPSIAFEAVPPPSPLADYVDSLGRMRDLPDARMLPAHGPVEDAVHPRVDALLRHHEDRLRHTAGAVLAGARTAREVAGRLTWTRHRRRFEDLNTFNRMLAVTETAAHLDLLVDRGDLAAQEVNGVRHYRPAPTPGSRV